MKCTVCGNDILVKHGEWLVCLNCGAEFFDKSIGDTDYVSPTKEIERLERENGYSIKAKKPINSKPVIDLPEKANSPMPTEDSPIQQNTAPKEKTVTKRKKKKKEDDKPKKSKLRETIEFFTPILIAFIVAIVLKNFVFANAQVPTGSMLNTIQKGDHIIASRLSYVFDEPERYDIVIFEYPDWEIDPSYSEKTYFVKRIIGMPNETVEIKRGKVYVTSPDGQTTELRDDFVTNCIPRGDYGPYVVPDGCYFMLGDNRNDSKDSRFWKTKFVEKEKILGEVKFRYYPNISTIE